MENDNGTVKYEESMKDKVFDDRGKFKEGHPKIGGVIKGQKYLTTKLKEALLRMVQGKNSTVAEELINSIIKNAIVKEDVRAQKLIIGYTDGLPTQRIDLGSDDADDTLKKIKAIEKNLNERYRKIIAAGGAGSGEGTG